jgi:hypothetical protein
MVRLGIVALVGAGILGYMTYTEGTLASRSSGQPEEFTAKQLIARGTEGNANVIVTDFVLCDNLVHQFNQNSPNSWTDVWIPIVAKDEAGEPNVGPITPKRVKVLFYSTRIHSQNELESRLNQPRVQGLITNRITSLAPKIRDLLQQNYPETDFDTCLIVQEGRSPWGMGGVLLLGGAAFACVLIAVGFFVGAAVRRR